MQKLLSFGIVTVILMLGVCAIYNYHVGYQAGYQDGLKRCDQALTVILDSLKEKP